MRERATVSPVAVTVVCLPILLLSQLAWTDLACEPRFNTLEDIYGDTGNTFQAAVGFVNFEGDTTGAAQSSYGMGVDDMVVKWREFTLDEDVTDCDVNFACASLALDTGRVYEGQTVLTITVLETTPSPDNDCDQDGVLDGTIDCDSNGVRDVAVKANSEVDVVGEAVILNCRNPPAVPNPAVCEGSEYTGTMPISSLSDAPGVVFVAIQGSDNPTVTVTYKDEDIDPGPAVEKCPNDVDPSKQGLVRSITTVFLGAACEVSVVGTEITDNGDKDGIVDTKERAEMRVCVINNCRQQLNNCTGRLFTNSETVDCILDSTIDMGSLPDSEDVVCTDEAFVWQMTGANRNDVNDDFRADFNFTMTCDEIDGLSVTQEFGMQLDLTLDDYGQPSADWFEGFETGTLGKFFPENLDEGIPGQNNTEGQINGDGWRCQYSNFEWHAANNYGDTVAAEVCFPGASLAGANAIYWGVDGTTTGSPDGGRAFAGDHSAYYGIYLTEPAGNFTSPMASVESIATDDIINLGVGAPQLTFWHQISIMDGRGLGGIPAGRSADRGVVQVKTVDLAGDDVSEWTQLVPFANTYANQAVSNYFNCMFDPVDDGNTEDDFFDPEDPSRSLGPSSTCFPELTFACQGDTDEDFVPTNICQALNEPAANSHDNAFGTGTWVLAEIDLSVLRGRRVKLRFLVSSLQAEAEDWEGQFANNPSPYDDGWWIDNVRIDDTLSNPANLVIDDKVLMSCADNPDQGCLTTQDCIDAGDAGPCTGPAPECGETCTLDDLMLGIVTDPDDGGDPLAVQLSAPGQPIEIDASASSGTCLDGALQFRFDRNGSIARDYSENPVLIDAPALGATYDVYVRCSADTACEKTSAVAVSVDCPGDVVTFPEFETIIAQSDEATLSWTSYVEYFLVRGDLSLVSSYDVLSSHAGAGTSFTDAAVPAVGDGLYYVVRQARYCNQQSLWTSGGVNESPARENSLP